MELGEPLVRPASIDETHRFRLHKEFPYAVQRFIAQLGVLLVFITGGGSLEFRHVDSHTPLTLNTEGAMSFTRLVICASFTGSLLALSVQPSGIATATEAAALLVVDQPSSSSQGADSHREKKGKPSPESSEKIQSNEKDPAPRLKHENDGTSEGSKRQDSHSEGSKGTPTLPGGGSNANTGPGNK